MEKQSDKSGIIYFSDLLEMTAKLSPDLRIRFSTSHPKDITNDVLKVIKNYEKFIYDTSQELQLGNNR